MNVDAETGEFVEDAVLAAFEVVDAGQLTLAGVHDGGDAGPKLARMSAMATSVPWSLASSQLADFRFPAKGHFRCWGGCSEKWTPYP